MRHEEIKDYGNAKFKRLTGVKKETFEKMVEILKKEMRDFGRPPKLSRADQLLLTLMYLREYRTQFHIGVAYGVSEATVCRTIQKNRRHIDAIWRIQLARKEKTTRKRYGD